MIYIQTFDILHTAHLANGYRLYITSLATRSGSDRPSSGTSLTYTDRKRCWGLICVERLKEVTNTDISGQKLVTNTDISGTNW